MWAAVTAASLSGSAPGVGDAGAVYAVDASADQLRIARSRLAHRRNVRFVHASIEGDPLRGRRRRLIAQWTGAPRG
jgi:ubiquinone/menaquinone biosynthesis C-methylase UbiE